MFQPAIYQGKSVILAELAKFRISQDTLDIVQEIGPSKFIKMAKSGKLVDTILLRQYPEWFITCPDSVKDIICHIYNKQSYEVNDESWLTSCCMHIALLDFEILIDVAPEWYNYAPKNFKFIIEKALGDEDVLDYNPYISETVINYLDEAIRVAHWAALI